MYQGTPHPVPSDELSSVFFEYERGQKLGLWVLAIDTGLLVGPIGKLELVPWASQYCEPLS